MTPEEELYIAAERSDFLTCKKLIDEGASVDHNNINNDELPLHAAIRNNNIEIFNLLIDNSQM